MKNKEDAANRHSIKDWWAENPMTYGIVHGDTQFNSSPNQPVSLGSREFFDSADNRFYAWNTPLHNGTEKFGAIFNYEKFRGKKVLEIGCGMGCMAMNWAQRGAEMTAVDLNPVAVEQSRRRFELFGLSGQFQEMDARALQFRDATFDYVYSWGVLHHSPDLERSIQEIHRVLKPGGETGIMLYNRESLLYRYSISYLEGFLHRENSFLTPLELASRYTDGGREEGNPHTWPVTQEEILTDHFASFEDVHIDVLGTDIESVLDLACPRMGSWFVPKFIQKALGKRWGWSLWIKGSKT